MPRNIKKFIKDNKWYLADVAVYSTVAIVTYTTICRAFGYEMNKPYQYDENYFYVKKLSGKVLRAEMFPTKK